MSGNIAKTGKYQDLNARVIAALGLGAIALLALSSGTIATSVFVAIAAGIMAQELSRLTHAETDLSPLAGFGMMVLLPLATVIAAFSVPFAVAVIGLGAVALYFLNDLRFGKITWAGYAVIGLACVAAVAIRGGELGFLILVWLILCVIGADVGGYFAGRSFGGPKLWPAVSPKKTWSGFIGGIVLSVIASIVMALIVSGAMSSFVVLGVIIAAVALCGDLLESAAKRHFGVKDSGTILPGHGGLLDRFDGLAAVLVLFFLMSLFGDLSGLLGLAAT